MPNVCDGVSTTAGGSFTWTNPYTRQVKVQPAASSWPLPDSYYLIDGGGSVSPTVNSNAAAGEYPYKVTFTDVTGGDPCGRMDAQPKIIIQVGRKGSHR